MAKKISKVLASERNYKVRPWALVDHEHEFYPNTVADIAARDAITAPLRYEGVIVYVKSDMTTYQLRGGEANANWVTLVSAGGVTSHTQLADIGTNTHAQIDTHIADTDVHFTMATISITESQISDLGSYALASHNHDATYLGISDTAVAADALSTTGANVDVSAAAAPVAGQVLTATSATTATWQTPSSPAVGDIIQVGTMADTYIAYFTADKNLSGNSSFTYDDAAELFTLAGGSPEMRIQDNDHPGNTMTASLSFWSNAGIAAEIRMDGTGNLRIENAAGEIRFDTGTSDVVVSGNGDLSVGNDLTVTGYLAGYGGTPADGSVLQWVTANSRAEFILGVVMTGGTPVDNQVAVFSAAAQIEGDANFTWDGADFTAGELFWDGSLNRLSVGDGSIATAGLTIDGDITSSAFLQIAQAGTVRTTLRFSDASDRTELSSSADNITLRPGNVDNAVFTQALITLPTSVLITAELDITHTSTEADDHALEIDVDAAGFGDVKAIDVVYITGAIGAGTDEDVFLINVDESASGGGTVFGLEVVSTDFGSAEVWAVEVGATVGAISQQSGVFGDADTILVLAVDQTTALSSGGAGNISVFVADNDTVTIGEATTFQEIEWILDTVSSGSGIAPTFEYSTGVGTWASFTPTDGTNGLRNNGIMLWQDADIPSWAPGTGSEYLIRITRTRNSLATSPIADLVQTSVTVGYYWNKSGDINVNTIALDGTAVTATAEEINLLDLSGLTAGWVLSADSATTASWKAPTGGGGSPLTTKGDVFTYDTGDQRLAVGTDGQMLVADSAEATGLKWDDPIWTETATSLFAGTGVLTSSTNAVIIGVGACDIDAAGSGSVVIGYQAGSGSASGNGFRNVYIGEAAGVGASVSTSTYQVAMGYNALNGTGGSFIGGNIAIGGFAMGSKSTGTAEGNIAIGFDAMRDINTAGFNVAIGYDAGYNLNSGNRNVMIGQEAGRAINNGEFNVAVGYQALGDSVGTLNSNYNTAVGFQSLDNLLSGAYNTGLGSSTLGALSGGQHNVAVGSSALQFLDTGDHNTALGYQAGINFDLASSRNVAIGYLAGPTVLSTYNDRLYIHNAQSDTPLIYGDFSTSILTINGQLATIASTATQSGFRIAEGVAPTTPADGDIWITAAGAFNVRLNGVTVDLAAASGPDWKAGTETGFHSIGIDDNCTGERLEIQDTYMFLGTDTLGSDYQLRRVGQDGSLTIMGGDSISNGLSLRLYSGMHSTQANDFEFKADNSNVLIWDNSATLLTLTGDLTVTGLLQTSASDATEAGLNIPEGVAPTTPNDGDVWVTAAGEFFVRLNGVSVDLAAGGGGGIGGSITDNQIAVGAATADDIEGSSSLTWNGTTLDVGGTVTVGINNTVLDAQTSAYLDVTSDNAATSAIRLRTSDNTIRGYLLANTSNDYGLLTHTAEWGVRCRGNAETSLYYNNSEKFKTTNSGVQVNGDLDMSGGQVNLVASNSTAPSMNIAEGVAPTTPVDGDVWVTAAGGFFARLNGVSVDLAAGGGGSPWTYTLQSGTSYTAAAGDFVVASNTGTVTITLPSGHSVNDTIIVKKTGSGGTVTVDGNASETIDGALTFALTAQYASITLISDGTNWLIV